MPENLMWLRDVLVGVGLKVAEQAGWQVRGHDSFGPTRGVMIHHTVGSAKGNMPSLDTLTHGRAASATQKALRGPLANLGLGRDGTFYVIAARLAHHAGVGSYAGISTGNASFIGIECENTGTPSDAAWPEVQMDALHRGVAALLRRVGSTPDMCCGHKEYAPVRKPVDPRLDMDAVRRAVADIMGGGGMVRPLIPAVAATGEPTLRRGAKGESVDFVQEKIGLKPVDGEFGAKTEAAVREFQRQHGLVPDGIVGPKTWATLNAS